jgi:tetratricopeptide (TPR) repeat protein
VLHPLVRAFVGSQLAGQSTFEQAARGRWVEWYVELVSQVGYCWNDLERLQILDREHETVYGVIEWSAKNQRDTETILLVNGSEYYYDVRGLWNKWFALELIGVIAAQNLNDTNAEAQCLARLVEILVHRGNMTEAESYLVRLNQLAHNKSLQEEVLFFFYQANFLYTRECGDMDAAQKTCERMLNHAQTESPLFHIAGTHWLATCHYQRGDFVDAGKLLREAIKLAEKYRYQRSAIFESKLALVQLDQGNLDNAKVLLEGVSKQVYEHRDRRYIARSQRAYASLHALRYDLRAAQIALTEAIDLFERMGMRRELAEAREELARLEAQMAAAAE